MEKLKTFFHTFYSFCKDHKREIFIALMVFLVASVFCAFVFNFTGCRGLWSLDSKVETEQGTMTTKINYQDNDFPIVNGDKEEKDK